MSSRNVTVLDYLLDQKGQLLLDGLLLSRANFWEIGKFIPLAYIIDYYFFICAPAILGKGLLNYQNQYFSALIQVLQRIQSVLCDQVYDPEKCQKIVIYMKLNFILQTQILENGLVFLEDSEGYLYIAHLFNKRMARKIRFFNLCLYRLQELLFRQISNMPHDVFYFNSSASHTLAIDGGYFYSLAYNGASCWDVILGILKTQGTDEFIQEQMNLFDNFHVIGDVQFLQLSTHAIFVNFLHLITNFKYTARQLKIMLSTSPFKISTIRTPKSPDSSNNPFRLAIGLRLQRTKLEILAKAARFMAKKMIYINRIIDETRINFYNYLFFYYLFFLFQQG